MSIRMHVQARPAMVAVAAPPMFALDRQRPVTRGASLTIAPPIVHEVLRSPGQPLDVATRASMEARLAQEMAQVPARGGIPRTPPAHLVMGAEDSRYEREADWMARQVGGAITPSRVDSGPTGTPMVSHGYNLVGVRIHTDAKAAASAQAINARAFTVGEHIVFGPGEYAPRTGQGHRLLAHELTHVMQQSSGSPQAGWLLRSIQDAFDQYRGQCACGQNLGNNCAHYLSDAFILAGYNELDGGVGSRYRTYNGRVVCESGRPVRAREMRAWFAAMATDTHQGEPDDNRYWAVFQQQPGGYWGGHVVIHHHSGTSYTWRGTGDYPGWSTQEHYTW